MSNESETWIIEATDGTQAMVSECDWLFLVGYNWNKDHYGYFRCTSRGTWNGQETHAKKLHGFVAELMGLKVPDGFEIDHIDRNPLNNQRSNLRIASRMMQNHNRSKSKDKTSRYIGVHFDRVNGKLK